MIRIQNNLWIGNSSEEKLADLTNIAGILNVAQDMQATRGWFDGVEHMQVGLIDGPGNELSAYYAAVLALVTLMGRGNVMICCHTRTRSLVVALMYLHLVNGYDWDEWMTILRERVDEELPVPHEAHRAAFRKINWRLLKAAAGGGI